MGIGELSVIDQIRFVRLNFSIHSKCAPQFEVELIKDCFYFQYVNQKKKIFVLQKNMSVRKMRLAMTVRSFIPDKNPPQIFPHFSPFKTHLSFSRNFLVLKLIKSNTNFYKCVHVFELLSTYF
jgi:hypothetical protein